MGYIRDMCNFLPQLPVKIVMLQQFWPLHALKINRRIVWGHCFRRKALHNDAYRHFLRCIRYSKPKNSGPSTDQAFKSKLYAFAMAGYCTYPEFTPCQDFAGIESTISVTLGGIVTIMSSEKRQTGLQSYALIVH